MLPVETFPATSLQFDGTAADAPSGPPYVTGVQPPTPERLSVAVKLTTTAWLYQPFASGPRAGAPPVTFGGVLSNLKLGTGADDVRPATSWHDTLPDADVLSGPEYAPEHGEGGIPDTASDGLAVNATGALYHPAWSALRARPIPLMVGSVLSILISAVPTDAEPPVVVTEQLRPGFVPSDEIVPLAQPVTLVIVSPFALIVQVMTTSLKYQPAFPAVPLNCTLISGGPSASPHGTMTRAAKAANASTRFRTGSSEARPGARGTTR